MRALHAQGACKCMLYHPVCRSGAVILTLLPTPLPRVCPCQVAYAPTSLLFMVHLGELASRRIADAGKYTGAQGAYYGVLVLAEGVHLFERWQEECIFSGVGFYRRDAPVRVSVFAGEEVEL